jgi:3-polyprenyl-4-hydroxybenzoate decarboxylase
LLLEAPSFDNAPELANDVLPHLQAETFQEWPLVILVDDLALALEPTGFLWQVFTRFDPAHDIYATTELRHHRFVYHGPILIDARMKLGYPGEVLPDAATIKLVDRRWKEYGV